MVDITNPIENPDLMAAIVRVESDTSDEAKDALLVQLQLATYLAAVITDEMNISQGSDGGTTIGQGSCIKFLSAESDGKRYLPLFTDWQAIRAYTETEVGAFLFSASEAWSFALDNYDAIVINSPHGALPLERRMLEFLRQHSKESKGRNA